MSPKGQKNNRREMGGVYSKGDFWLATVKIDGRTICGPPRFERGEGRCRSRLCTEGVHTSGDATHITAAANTQLSSGVQALPDPNPEAHGEAQGGVMESIEEVAEKPTCAQGAAAALTSPNGPHCLSSCASVDTGQGVQALPGSRPEPFGNVSDREGVVTSAVCSTGGRLWQVMRASRRVMHNP